MSKDVKVGDVVHVRGIAMDNHKLYPAVRFEGVSHDIDVRAVDIVHVETRPLQVGDVVTWGMKQLTGRILATDNDSAWVKIESGGNGQIGLRTNCTMSILERV